MKTAMRSCPAHRRRCRVKTKSADKPGSVTAHVEVRYGRHSSRRRVAAALKPPTRGLDEQPVLPNARPLTWCCSGWRLPRFTRFRLTGSDSSLWPCSSLSSAALAATYGVRALPGILLYGARTFLSPRGLRHDGQRRSGWLRTTRLHWGTALIGREAIQRHTRRFARPRLPRRPQLPIIRGGSAIRQRIVSPARSGTIVSAPNGYSAGTVHGVPLERDRVGVARQPVEVRAEAAREAFEPVERVRVLERLGVQLERRVAPSSIRRSRTRSPSCAARAARSRCPGRTAGCPTSRRRRAPARCVSRFRIGRQ